MILPRFEQDWKGRILQQQSCLPELYIHRQSFHFSSRPNTQVDGRKQ